MTTTTNRRNHDHGHLHPSRKDLNMQHVELRLADVEERQLRFRDTRDADRAALVQARSLRQRVGRTLVRLGTLVGGDAISAPAWQG
jgi:hypothetical protein